MASVGRDDTDVRPTGPGHEREREGCLSPPDAMWSHRTLPAAPACHAASGRERQADGQTGSIGPSITRPWHWHREDAEPLPRVPIGDVPLRRCPAGKLPARRAQRPWPNGGSAPR